MKAKVLLIGSLGIALLGVSALSADTLSVALGSEFAVIQGSLPGNTKASRIVVAAPLSGLPSQSEIDYAEVTIPYFLPTGFTGILQVEARPITRGWNRGSVTWSNPWQRPGGDFDSTRIATFALGKVGEVRTGPR